MEKYDLIREKLALDHLPLQGDSLSAVTGFFLRQISRLMQETSTIKDPTWGKVHQRYIAALFTYIESEYCTGCKRTLEEILVENNATERTFWDHWNELLLKPYQAILPHCDVPGVASVYRTLSETVHAINRTQLWEMVGSPDEGIFRFILSVCGLTEIKYSFKPFKDPYLEILYSNDGISLDTAKNKTLVNRFFRFFIDGEAEDCKDYSPNLYYGSLPVSVNKIKSFCEKENIKTDIMEKLLSIVKCSSRFNEIVDGDDIKYALKVQYLNNYLAMSVSIIYKEGRPLHKEELKARIDTLHSRYPNLVDSYSIDSFVLRRKPILCAAGAQGEWSLRTWKTNVTVFDAIRTFVEKEYSRQKRPISLDEIVDELQSKGYTYDKRTIRTYVTKIGCISKRNGLYLPPDAEEGGDIRYWTGKLYLIQRYAAKCLLTAGKTASRKEIRAFICREDGHSINIATFERALKERPDLFSITGNNRRSQRILLSDEISGFRDVNRVITEPKKKEPDYVINVRRKMEAYLLEHKEARQKDMSEIFIMGIPERLKEREATIRKILSDKQFFQKRKTSLGCIVSLNPNYRARLEIEKQEKTHGPQLQETPFSWEGLKIGMMKQLLKDHTDQLLSSSIDNVFKVFRCGNDEMPLNANFSGMVSKLFKYVVSTTSADDRWELQKEILGLMEAFLRSFYQLKYNDLLLDLQGFGALKMHFRDVGLFPDKNQNYLSSDEMTIYRIIESVNIQRNKDYGHIMPQGEKSDKLAINIIHNCLSLMVYLGKQL